MSNFLTRREERERKGQQTPSAVGKVVLRRLGSRRLWSQARPVSPPSPFLPLFFFALYFPMGKWWCWKTPVRSSQMEHVRKKRTARLEQKRHKGRPARMQTPTARGRPGAARPLRPTREARAGLNGCSVARHKGVSDGTVQTLGLEKKERDKKKR